MQSEMLVMDRTGHTTIKWNPDNEDEVAVAEATFKEMTGKGYSAFRVETVDQKGRRLTGFDPDAAKMILVPHLVGG